MSPNADGLKIDFTFYPAAWLQAIVQSPALPAELDAGHIFSRSRNNLEKPCFRGSFGQWFAFREVLIILLDKDGLTTGMKPPTHLAYIPAVPTDEIYQKWIQDFLSDAPYAAKCLLRGELLPLKWCLDYDMRHIYLRQMLEWKIGLDTGWSIPVGSWGKGLKKRLSPEIWSQLEGVVQYNDAFPGSRDRSWQKVGI